VAGIEPASFGGSSRLLRAQPAVVFSAPAVAQAPCRGLSHCLISLPTPWPGRPVEPSIDARFQGEGAPGLTVLLPVRQRERDARYWHLLVCRDGL